MQNSNAGVREWIIINYNKKLKIKIRIIKLIKINFLKKGKKKHNNKTVTICSPIYIWWPVLKKPTAMCGEFWNENISLKLDLKKECD